MREWKKGKLALTIQLVMGQSPSGDACNNDKTGVPLLNGPTEFGDHHPFPIQFTTDPKKFAEIGDILFCVRGSTTGRMNWADQKYAIGRGIAAIRHKKGLTYQYFLKALIDYKLTQMLKTTTGSTFPNISKDQFLNLEILLPSSEDQKNISSIFSSIDNKIDLLRRQNETLEAIAQTLFKRWFVEFEFPNEKGQPYKSSGGKMVSSELGKIPEGWRVGKLTEIFDFLEGPGIRNWQYKDEGIPFINIRLINNNNDIDISNANFISSNEANGKYKHFQLKQDDMVVSTSGTLGRTAIVREPHLPLILNTSVIRFRPIDKFNYAFMYGFLKSNFFKRELISLASGSVQLNFGPTHLKMIDLIIPNNEVLKNFQMICEKLHTKTIKNLDAISTWTKTRDTLLPKLMSGQIRVK